MRHITFMRWFDEGAKTVRWYSTNDPIYEQDHSGCVSLNFILGGRLSKRDVHLTLERLVKDEKFTWLKRHENRWSLGFPAFRRYLTGVEVNVWPPDQFKPLDGLDWLDRAVMIEPDIEYRLRNMTSASSKATLSPYDFQTIVALRVYRDDFFKNIPMKIFLSHKGIDKPLARDVYETLKTLGFDPWLDEKAMSAGIKLERGLKQGFKDSCAAVFFITPRFKDLGYLATEVEYAIQEERDKGDRFKIICILFKGKRGIQGEVPELLRGYVWKEPKTRLEALRMIVQALPIELGQPTWKVM
jgi:TIR domain